MSVTSTILWRRWEHLLIQFLRYGFAGLLLVTGIAKLIFFRDTMEVLVNFTWIPDFAMVLIALGLPVVEITLGLMLLLRRRVKQVLPLILTLFVIFTAVSIYGTLFHIPGDCGCFGGLTASAFGWGMVMRNLLFLTGIGYLWRHRDRIDRRTT